GPRSRARACCSRPRPGSCRAWCPADPWSSSLQTWVSFGFRVQLGLELDLDVDVGGQVEAHERVDRLRRRVDDVDEALVGALLEVLAAVLVLVRRTDHDDHVLLRRERHGADDGRARTGHGVDDLARRCIEAGVVVRLQPDADLLSRHGQLSSLSPYGTGSARTSARPSTRTAVLLSITWTLAQRAQGTRHPGGFSGFD